MKKWMILFLTFITLTSCGVEKTLPEIETKQETEDSEYDSSAEQEESESEPELLERFEYEYDENNKVIIGVFKDARTINTKYMIAVRR